MKDIHPLEKYLDPELRTLLKLIAQDKISDDLVRPGEIRQLNVQRLIKLAALHRLTYSVLQFSRNHGELFAPEQLSLLAETGRKNAVRSLQQLNELIKICSHLNESRLPYVCIKGPQLASMLYGKSAVKESVDLDIMLVNGNELEVFHKILSGFGFTRSNLNNRKWINRRLFLLSKREVHLSNPLNGIHIDLHVSPGANTHLTKKFFGDFYADRQIYRLENIDIPVFPPEKYLLYLCYHGSLHQYSRLGWLADVRTFIQLKRDELDFDKLLSIALLIKTDRSVFLTFNLLHRIFSDEIPVGIKNSLKEPELVEKLTRECLKAISYEPGFDMSLLGRYHKFLFLFRLSKGAPGKMDYLFSVFMRHFIRLLGLIK
jgi:hypothetical protein